MKSCGYLLTGIGQSLTLLSSIRQLRGQSSAASSIRALLPKGVDYRTLIDGRYTVLLGYFDQSPFFVCAQFTFESSLIFPPPFVSEEPFVSEPFFHVPFSNGEPEREVCVAFLSCNRLNLLDQTIRSSLRHLQSIEPDVLSKTETIWIDNGSQNRTELQMIQETFHHVLDKVVLLRENRGLPYALNRMYNLCEAPFLMSLENDWVVQPAVTEYEIPFFRMAIDVLKEDKRVIKVMGRKEYDHKYSRGRWKRTAQGTFHRRMCPDLGISRWRVFIDGPGLVRMDSSRAAGTRGESRPVDEDRYRSCLMTNAERMPIAFLRHVYCP